jgi:Flp pilus assembly protein TadD
LVPLEKSMALNRARKRFANTLLLCHSPSEFLQGDGMDAKRKLATAGVSLALALSVAGSLQGQQAAAGGDSATAQAQTDPLAGLSPENRELFDTLRKSSQQNDYAAVVAAGRKLLPVLKQGTPVSDFVTQLTAASSIETGESGYALTLLKPYSDAHPDDWRAAAGLARAYAEDGDKAARDQQIARLIAMHKKSSDPAFAKLHMFPIQKVALKSGYAVFLYPFEPTGKFHTYLIALVYTKDGKEDYRIELESDDVDQAFFKPKHLGERRFSIDTYRASADGGPLESQALLGFVDGVFDYDGMRDRMAEAANKQEASGK